MQNNININNNSIAYGGMNLVELSQQEGHDRAFDFSVLKSIQLVFNHLPSLTLTSLCVLNYAIQHAYHRRSKGRESESGRRVLFSEILPVAQHKSLCIFTRWNV